MKKTNVFISYSHKDERYKDDLLRHLKLLEKQGVASFWDTSLIPAGANWSQEIKNAVETASVAILLISPDFLSSDYVIQQELPQLIKRAQERNVVVLPLLIRPTSWTSVPELAQFQFLNDVTRPLSTSDKRDEEMAQIANRLAELLVAVSERQVGAPSRTPDRGVGVKIKDGKPPRNALVFLSHCSQDGDFAELTKLRLKEAGFDAWIDNDRLEPGIDWRQEIDDSIKTSIALIAIMSPEARESEYVTYEWAFAWGSAKPVVPIMLRETPLHPRLATLQYIDFTNRRARPWDRFIGTLRKIQERG